MATSGNSSNAAASNRRSHTGGLWCGEDTRRRGGMAGFQVRRPPPHGGHELAWSQDSLLDGALIGAVEQPCVRLP